MYLSLLSDVEIRLDNMQRRRLCIFVYLLVGFAYSNALGQSSLLYDDVPKEAVRCIVKNIDAYIALNKPINIIRPEICPETDILADAGEGASNMVGESFYKDSSGKRRRVATVVYTSRQLACLRDRAQVTTIEQLPKKPCAR